MRRGTTYRSLRPKIPFTKEDQRRLEILDAKFSATKLCVMLQCGDATLDAIRDGGRAAPVTIEKISRIMKDLIPCL